MSNIGKKFNELRKKGRIAFIAYITAGDPKLTITEKLIFELQNNGVDLIELGVPFSDPLADGPTIQKASERALKNGTTLKKIVGLVKRIRHRVKIPVCLMTYYNPVFKYGLNKFARDLAIAGVDGVIVPDLPPEESGGWTRAARKNNIDTIFLLAPTSDYDRIKIIAKNSTGFIYYVSLTGVTGARSKLDLSIGGSIARIKKITDKPVCVGFGISRRKHIEKLKKIGIDGVIVGSAIVKIIEKNAKSKNLVEKVGKFVDDLRRGI